MSTTEYFKDNFYPPNDNGNADKSKSPIIIELLHSSYFGSYECFLVVDGKQIAITKEQAELLSDALTKVGTWSEKKQKMNEFITSTIHYDDYATL